MEKETLNQINSHDIFIFDFDGTLVDSEPIHKQAHSTVFSLLLEKPIKLTQTEYFKLSGKSDIQIYTMLKESQNANFNISKAIKKKIKVSNELMKESKLKIFDYFFEIAKHKNKNQNFYIVSNGTPSTVKTILKENNALNYFDKLFFMPKLKLTKQEFYENINQYIKTNNKKVVVFEDSISAISYARKNNFFTVGIETKNNKNKLKTPNIIINCI